MWDYRSEEFKVALGKKLRTVRESAGLSQKVIADETGLTYNHICNIENGRTIAPVYALMTYMHMCHVTPNEILSDFTEEKNRYLSYYNAIAKRDRQTVNELLEVMYIKRDDK